MKPTVVQIAGTSGSGKSHLMRAFLKRMRKEAQLVKDVGMAGREGPGGYLVLCEDGEEVFVPGNYDTPTGGCDTIKEIKTVYELIEAELAKGRHVAYEGLFCMNQTRGPRLAAELGKRCVVLQLTTPLATCLASVNIRRAERGAGELANKKNTEDNYKRSVNFCASMREAGARVIRVSRDEGLDTMLEVLGIQ